MSLNAISMFAEKDILIENDTSQTLFEADYTTNGGTLSKLNTGTPEELCNWKTDTPLHGCFQDATGNWNTSGRTITGTMSPNQRPGFGAEGMICGYTGSPTGICTTSVADGMYAYDSTTGTKGNQLQFVDKEDPSVLGPGGSNETNPPGTISYPFPRPDRLPRNSHGWLMSKADTIHTFQ